MENVSYFKKYCAVFKAVYFRIGLWQALLWFFIVVGPITSMYINPTNIPIRIIVMIVLFFAVPNLVLWRVMIKESMDDEQKSD